MKKIDIEMKVVLDGDPKTFLRELKKFVERSGVMAAEIVGGYDVPTDSETDPFEAELNKIFGLSDQANAGVDEFQGEVRKILDSIKEDKPEHEFNTKMNSIEEWLRRYL